MLNFFIGVFVGAMLGFFTAALLCTRKKDDEQYAEAMKQWERGMERDGQWLERAEKWLKKQEAKEAPCQQE